MSRLSYWLWRRQKLFKRSWELFPNENVVLKVPFFDVPVRKSHHSFPMLDPSTPTSLIVAAISPSHLSISFPLIIQIAPLIHIPALPFELTLSMLLVIQIVSRILI